MKKTLLKAAITTALTVAFTVPAFANPFSDVPANSWAYQAVSKLAQAGIVDGYGDGTFRGDKPITRYEMAQIVAKAMNKNLNADQKATVDQLSKEFATELNTLGVKVDGLQNQMDNMIKFDGDARLRYIETKQDATGKSDNMDYRVRLGATGKINDDMSIYARISTGNNDQNAGKVTASMDNAYVKGDVFGVTAKLGRQDYDLGQGSLAGGASVAIMNGLTVRDGNFMAFGGRENNNTVASPVMVNTYGAQYKFHLGAPITADYMKQGGNEYTAVSTKFNLIPQFKVSGEYMKNITAGADGYKVKGDIGKTGLSVAYKDFKQGSLPLESAENLLINTNSNLRDFYAVSTTQEAKGMEYEYTKDIAKNTNLDILYQDIDHAGSNIRATASVKF